MLNHQARWPKRYEEGNVPNNGVPRGIKFLGLVPAPCRLNCIDMKRFFTFSSASPEEGERATRVRTIPIQYKHTTRSGWNKWLRLRCQSTREKTRRRSCSGGERKAIAKVFEDVLHTIVSSTRTRQHRLSINVFIWFFCFCTRLLLSLTLVLHCCAQLITMLLSCRMTNLTG